MLMAQPLSRWRSCREKVELLTVAGAGDDKALPNVKTS